MFVFDDDYDGWLFFFRLRVCSCVSVCVSVCVGAEVRRNRGKGCCVCVSFSVEKKKGQRLDNNWTFSTSSYLLPVSLYVCICVCEGVEMCVVWWGGQSRVEAGRVMTLSNMGRGGRPFSLTK
jgi:hypothetical protein